MKFHRPPAVSLIFQAGFWAVHYTGVVILMHGFVAPGQSWTWLALLAFEILHIACVNIHLYIFIPSLLRQKKWFRYAAATLLLILATTLFKIILSESILTYIDPDFFGMFRSDNSRGLALFSTVFVTVLSLPLLFIDYLIQREQLKVQLHNQQLQSELRFLRAQLNPHLLFNVLNNIYALVLTRSEHAGPMVLDLSEMMRYMLYETQGQRVPVQKEADFIRRYIGLHTFKQRDESTVSFVAAELPPGCTLPPLLLIPLVENAFKYSDWDSETGEGWIKAKLTLHNQRLDFTITNSLPPRIPEFSDGGIGLTNIRQRLQMLYPDQFELGIQSTPTTFSVHLTVPITSTQTIQP